MKALRAFAAILGSLAIIVFVASVAYQAGKRPATQNTFAPTPVPTPPAAPVWDWTRVQTDSFSIDAGGGRTGYGLPQGSRTARKILVQAKAPVLVAYFPESENLSVISNPIGSLRRPIWHCVNQHVLTTTIQCPLPIDTESFRLLIKDERTGGQALAAGLLGGLGVKQPLEDATIRNDVTVELWEFKCMSNCPRQQQQ